MLDEAIPLAMIDVPGSPRRAYDAAERNDSSAAFGMAPVMVKRFWSETVPVFMTNTANDVDFVEFVLPENTRSGPTIRRVAEVLDQSPLTDVDDFLQRSGHQIKATIESHYRLWKGDGSATSLGGTPIEEWRDLPQAILPTLKSIGFHTIEAVAKAPESMAASVGVRNFGELKALAMRHVDLAAVRSDIEEARAVKDDVAAMKQALTAKDDAIAELKDMVRQMLDARTIDEDEEQTAEPRRRGRPPRVVEPAQAA